jgi:ABC-type dipeptide/oligopeptide/nickel transport system ATPase subunit
MEPLIVCENLVKIFKVAELEVVALQGLDLTVQRGEMLGIVGASGSGKSTLLNILGGLDRPSAGRVVVNGLGGGTPTNLLKAANAELDSYRRREVGFVWQQTARNLIPYLSAQQNVALPNVDVVPSEAKAEGVFAALSEYAGGAEQFRGLNILLPRAAVGRDYLPKALEEAGARVDVVTAYRTVIPENLDRGRLSAMLAGGADCIAFTSSSTVKNLALLFDTHDLSKILSGVAIACIGEITGETAREHGLKPDIQPVQSTVKDLANAISVYYSQ